MLKAKLVTALALSLFAIAGCDEASPDPASAAPGGEAAIDAEAALGKDVLVEEHDKGSISWHIGADGQVKALVRNTDGKAITNDVTGSLAFKTKAEADGEAAAEAKAKVLPLAADAKTGLLVAAGPKLEADVTEIGYTLNVEGKPWSGTLHVPAGGTAELVASARASAEADLEGKVGPHGGVLVLVGADRFEIVADEATGEVRVYLLDADLEVIAVGEREATLAVVADAPRVVLLVPEPEAGLYLRGKLNLKADPLRITLAVRHAGKVRVALVGFKPGVKLMVHAKAPRLKIRVKGKAIAAVDAKIRANAKAKVNVKAKAPGVDVKVKKPSVDAKASAGKGGKAKASAKVKIGF